MKIYKLPVKSKYVLGEAYARPTEIKGISIHHSLFGISLSLTGTLMIRSGFHWDGASGPAVDIKEFMRPSLVHDALYILMRDRFLSADYREYADQLLREMCLEEGMSEWYANLVYYSVRKFGGNALKKKMKLL